MAYHKVKGLQQGKKLRAVFYARVSTDEEKQLNALENQIRDNREIIEEMGWELVGEYIDEGKSGTSTKRRNDYRRLLDDMEEDKFDIIITKDQDRLQRNTRDWYLFVDKLVVNELQLFFYLDKKYYTPDDALITGIKAILSEEYSRNLSKKLNNSNRKRIERALKGEGVSAMGNGKGLGYAIVNKKWVQVPAEIEICKQIWDLYEQYDSIRKVRDEINNRGYTNSVGKPFTSESISRILKNEKAKGVIVIGKLHHDFEAKKVITMPEEEWVRVPAPELAYVSEERFDKVQERLKSKTSKGRGVFGGSDPLSGKIFCGKCGEKYWRHQSNGYYNWFCKSQYAKGEVACEGSGTITTVKIRKIFGEISKELVVDKKAVTKTILDWLNSLKKSLTIQRDNSNTLKELERLEKRKNKLTEAYLDEIISKEDYKVKYAEIEGRLGEVQTLLAPVEENPDIIEIEKVIKNIDAEIDEYISTLEFEESKIDFLIEHTQRITVNGKHLIIELDLLAGAIIAGKDFLLFVHESVHLCERITDYTIEIKLGA